MYKTSNRMYRTLTEKLVGNNTKRRDEFVTAAMANGNASHLNEEMTVKQPAVLDKFNDKFS